MNGILSLNMAVKVLINSCLLDEPPLLRLKQNFNCKYLYWFQFNNPTVHCTVKDHHFANRILKELEGKSELEIKW